METIQLALIEDDPVVYRSLITFFGDNPQFSLVLAATSIEDFLAKLDEQTNLPLDILLLDIQLPGLSGIEGIPLILDRQPELSIIMLTTFEDNEHIFAALCAGACSYLSKRTSLVKIQEAIQVVSRGGSYMSPSIARKVVQHFAPKAPTKKIQLTTRQQEIVEGIVDGLSYKMVAARLDISLDTVRTHIKHIYRALNINSKGELIKHVLENKR